MTKLSESPQTPSPVQPSEFSLTYRGQSLGQRRATGLIRWFNNQPINRKQLLTVGTSFLSIVGLIWTGNTIIARNLNTQLLTQAEAETAVADIEYNIKINQMSFGFRGQSDNTAVIAAARAGQEINGDLKGMVGRILQNEIKARNIEFATLVDRNRRIVVGGNRDRQGEIFDPNGLVSRVLKDPRQLKASALLPWSEIQKEQPPLPQGLKGGNLLVRYTVTPVRDPATNQIAGALVSGDVVNQKFTIVEEVVTALEGGYGAIYLRQGDGSFALVTSRLGDRPQVPLPDTTLLQAAVAKPNQVVTGELRLEGELFAIAVQSLPNVSIQGEKGAQPIANDQPPVAILVRGLSEAKTTVVLRDSLVFQTVIGVFVLGINLLSALLIAQGIATPIKALQQTTSRFARGDRQTRTNVDSQDELGQLARTFNEMADSIATTEADLAREARLNDCLAQIARTLEEEALGEPLEQFFAELAQGLLLDQVLLYRHHSDDRPLPCLSNYERTQTTREAPVYGPLEPDQATLLQQGNVLIYGNVYEDDIPPIHFALLKKLNSKAAVILPLRQGDRLFGLLIVSNNQQIHTWSAPTLSQLEQQAQRLALALGGLTLIAQQQQEATRMRQLNEQLQAELFRLLSSVEGASAGDLTVRAEISAGEIGIVADFFNAIIENLREIVVQVKQTAQQVNTSVSSNDTEIRNLAERAMTQSDQIQNTLKAVETMATSIQNVATNAQSAAQIARTAAATAEKGGIAMDRTVNSVLQLRQTVADTAKKVKRLGESSQQISKVISLINQIALQTNLLAINASIEAARAGEEGRGFAVVAEEVGQLAAQSAAATKEIEQIVEAIQLETSDVVQAMEQGTSQVVQGTKLISTTKHNLKQLIQVSKRIDSILQDISNATITQADTSNQVRSLMQAVTELAEQTALSSRTVSSSLQNTVTIAEQLQTTVGSFKVE